MLKTYDKTSSAYVESPPKIHSATAGAWIDAPSAKTYDATQSAWIERLKKYLELSVTDGFYNNSDNLVMLYDMLFCQIKPTYESIEISASIAGEFLNPVIACTYTFYSSDLCPDIASGFYSHASTMFRVDGVLNGEVKATEYLARGNNYAYEQIADEPASVTLTGTFDEIRIVCEVNSVSGYEKYGYSRATLDDLTIDGKTIEGKSTISAS